MADQPLTNADGPAFPVLARDPWHVVHTHTPGMSLRDWFAGQALAGYLANPITSNPNAVPAYAYALADAMLAAREAK